MHPLAAHTVHLLLQYISPLTDPIPPHLVSVPLRQRHHFLQISPSSPKEYLCWPSPDNAIVIGLLDRLPPSSDQAIYPTCYTSDTESTFAHVQISPDAQGLRMLFHWDHAHGWRYHDLRLMPFPSSAFLTPQESLTANSASAEGPLPAPTITILTNADHPDTGGDDSYWDAYGVAEQDLASPLAPPNTSMPSAVDGEDAYWARYASVQGSADSTVPSPFPINRKLQLANSNEVQSVSQFPPQNASTIDIPVETVNSRPLLSMPGPPSPNTLAHLLTEISPRNDILDDLHSVRSPSAYGSGPLSQQTATDSELVTPPSSNGYLDTSAVSPVRVKIVDDLLCKCHTPSLDEAEDRALANSIKGLFYLWKTGRKGEPDEVDRSAFLQVVQAAISY